MKTLPEPSKEFEIELYNGVLEYFKTNKGDFICNIVQNQVIDIYDVSLDSESLSEYLPSIGDLRTYRRKINHKYQDSALWNWDEKTERVEWLTETIKRLEKQI